MEERGLADLPDERGDEDQVAGAALEHRRVQRPGQQHRRLEVDPQGARHLLGAEVRQPAGPRQPRVGDEDVDLAGLGGQLLGGARLGQVGRQHPVALARQLRRQRLQRLGLARAQGDARPARRPAPWRSPVPRPPVAPVRSAVRPASSIPKRKLAARMPTGIWVPSAKGDKMFVFYEQAAGRSSTLPPFRITETPNPVRSEAPRERGNHVFGANPPLVQVGAQAPFAPARQLTP